MSTIESKLPKSMQTSGMNIGTFLAARLEEIGVKHFFTMPGDYNMALLDQILKNKNMKMISCCNELNAGFAADGYARGRGVSAVFVTYTVGSLPLVSAIAGAYSADLPVIVISGGPNSNDYGTNRVLHHTLGTPSREQTLEIFKQITADAVVVCHAADAASLIDRAISRALLTSKPVYIEISCNLAFEPAPMPVPYHIRPITPSNPRSLQAAVEAASQLLNNASKPVLVGGYKLRSSKAINSFLKLAESIGCGVATMPDAKGFFPEEHPNYIGSYWGSISSPYCCEIVESADVYLFAGPVFNDFSTLGYTTLIKKDKMIEVLPDRIRLPGAEFGCAYMAEFLEALAAAVKPNDGSLKAFHRIMKTESARDSPSIERQASSEPLQVAEIRKQVQELLYAGSKYAVLAETGDAWFHGQKLKLPDGTTYEFQMQYGSIGWSVGATLGYSLSQPNRVIAMIGDGSLQIAAQEISTMIRYNVNPIIVLINNFGYTIENKIHQGPYNSIKNWDYAGLVDVFNANEGKGISFKVKTEKGLAQALAEAATYDGFVLIECIVDPEDCARELLEFGTRVSNANQRPPKFAEDF